MKILVDTHILVYREFDRTIQRHLQNVMRYINDLNYRLVVHPRSVLEVEKDKNIINKSALISKIKTYSSLDSQSNPFDDKDFFTIIQKPKSERDTVDSYLLYCLYKKEVDLFLTEDIDIFKKAEQLNISNKVMNLQEASNFFKRRLEENKTKNSNVPVFSFYKNGKDWYIGEKGNEVRFDDMNGFGYIHYLLGYVNEDISIITVYNLGKGSGDDGGHEKMSEKDKESHGMDEESTIFIKRLSLKEKKLIQSNIDQLQDSMDSDISDPVDGMIKQEERSKQIEMLKKILNKKSDRDHTSQSEKIRTTVTRSIKRALLKINEDGFYMSRYLNISTINTGDTCVYKPALNDKPSWILYYKDNN